MKKSRNDIKKPVKKEEPKKTPPSKPVVITQQVDNTEVLKAINKLTETIVNKEFKATIPKPSVIQAPVKGIEEVSGKIDKLMSIVGKDKEVELTIFRDPQGRMHKIVAKPIV